LLFKYFLIKVFSVANGLRILVKPIPAFAFNLLLKLPRYAKSPDFGSINPAMRSLLTSDQLNPPLSEVSI
jgi:hypothetical protein